MFSFFSIFCEISVCIYFNIKHALTKIMHITSTSEALKISRQASKRNRPKCKWDLYINHNPCAVVIINMSWSAGQGVLDHAGRPGCMTYALHCCPRRQLPVSRHLLSRHVLVRLLQTYYQFGCCFCTCSISFLSPNLWGHQTEFAYLACWRTMDLYNML